MVQPRQFSLAEIDKQIQQYKGREVALEQGKVGLETDKFNNVLAKMKMEEFKSVENRAFRDMTVSNNIEAAKDQAIEYAFDDIIQDIKGARVTAENVMPYLDVLKANHKFADVDELKGLLVADIPQDAPGPAKQEMIMSRLKEVVDARMAARGEEYTLAPGGKRFKGKTQIAENPKESAPKNITQAQRDEWAFQEAKKNNPELTRDEHALSLQKNKTKPETKKSKREHDVFLAENRKDLEDGDEDYFARNSAVYNGNNDRAGSDTAIWDTGLNLKVKNGELVAEAPEKGEGISGFFGAGYDQAVSFVKAPNSPAYYQAKADNDPEGRPVEFWVKLDMLPPKDKKALMDKLLKKKK